MTIDTTTITLAEMRRALNNIGKQWIPDEILQESVDDASFRVYKERGADCDQVTFNNAVKWLGAFFAMLRYNIQYETAEGEAMPNAVTFLRDLEREANRAMGYASRSTAVPGPPRMVHDPEEASSSLTDL